MAEGHRGGRALARAGVRGGVGAAERRGRAERRGAAQCLGGEGSAPAPAEAADRRLELWVSGRMVTYKARIVHGCSSAAVLLCENFLEIKTTP